MIILHTPRLTVRNVVPADENDIFACCAEPDVGINAGWKPHSDISETRDYMQMLLLDKRCAFAIEYGGRAVGTLGLLPDPKRENPGAMMLGYSLSGTVKGRGFMTEAARAAIKFAFLDNPALSLVSAYCYPYNTASRRVIEKCGMTYEGALRECELRYDGTMLANLCFSISRAEFEQSEIYGGFQMTIEEI